MESKLTHEIKKDLHDLIGQCMKTIDLVLEEHGEDMSSITMDDAYAIDEIVFCCGQCNWFAGADERNDFNCEWVCDECYKEMDPEEDLDGTVEDMDKMVEFCFPRTTSFPKLFTS